MENLKCMLCGHRLEDFEFGNKVCEECEEYDFSGDRDINYSTRTSGRELGVWKEMKGMKNLKSDHSILNGLIWSRYQPKYYFYELVESDFKK